MSPGSGVVVARDWVGKKEKIELVLENVEMHHNSLYGASHEYV